MSLKHYCDACGEILDVEMYYPVFSYIGGEELIFCDTDCQDDFIKEHTKDVFIDLRGRRLED